MKWLMKSRTDCHSVGEILPDMSRSKIISTHSQLNLVPLIAGLNAVAGAVIATSAARSNIIML
jgi:hypothetical protein